MSAGDFAQVKQVPLGKDPDFILVKYDPNAMND